jgi:GrpB-like predicted nucleotidyltransferase (UPF0157 family)
MSSPDTRRIEVVPYRPGWAAEFDRLAAAIRTAAGQPAARVDHVGSTAVPGLAAKDVIDVQVSVAELDAAGPLLAALRDAGFRGGRDLERDEFPGMARGDPDLAKFFLREPAGERRAHVHVREIGRFNQRYALLFRDYLRASPRARDAYAELKRQAARASPDRIEGYMAIKDPAFALIWEAASLWAERAGWTPGADPPGPRPSADRGGIVTHEVIGRPSEDDDG